MKLGIRVLVCVVCILLLIASWVVVISSKSPAEKQLELMHQAAVLLGDGIYIRAVPLLEEAAEYNAAHTLAAEAELKKVYIALMDSKGFRRKYTSLLEKQMSRADPGDDVFAEAAKFYIGTSKVQEALVVLKSGIGKTGSSMSPHPA